jgi:hypothetical protein
MNIVKLTRIINKKKYGGGRYWDRLVDMFDLGINIDGVPHWFKCETGSES